MKWWNRWLTDDKRANRTALLVEALEPRVLQSADAEGVFVPAPGGLQQQTPTKFLLDDNPEPAPTQPVVQEKPRSDGVWQVSQALRNYSDVDAIHLVSLGTRAKPSLCLPGRSGHK